MPGAIPALERKARKSTAIPPPQGEGNYANEEISAYVAARDTLLTEAEEKPNAATVKRARLANDFVVNCLRPPVGPYGAQFLSEGDAVRELQRCREVSARLTQLSAR